MAHIKLNNQLPGIGGLLKEFPKTAKPLLELAQTLLRGDSTLSEGERELIATYVSSKNDCEYCQSTHGAAAKHLLGVDYTLIERIKKDKAGDEISSKMKGLLNIAGQVQISGKKVTDVHIEAAKDAGASDQEIHDTVLIAAAFCMFNRYVDGLGTHTPDDKSVYDERGAALAEKGYGWQT